MNERTLAALALFGAFGTTFDLLHEALDHWSQPDWAARHKRDHGSHLVYRDGVAVGQETDDRTGHATMTAAQLGRRACTCHVAIYAIGQLGATATVARIAGYRLPLLALLASPVINGITHWMLDRGPALQLLADAAGKRYYLTHMTVVRHPGGEADGRGAGTAWNELDRSAHRACGWLATAVTVGLTLRRELRE